MLLFCYLHSLPSIPADLLNNPIPNFELNNVSYIDGGENNQCTYTRWGITDELSNWIQEHIIENISLAGIQTMTWPDEVSRHDRYVSPHCDRRKWALNYIIDPGGPDVRTEFYLEHNQSLLRDSNIRVFDYNRLTTVHNVNILPGKWHLINTNVLHGVTNVETVRKAVTVGLNVDDPLSVIKGYQ